MYFCDLQKKSKILANKSSDRKKQDALSLVDGQINGAKKISEMVRLMYDSITIFKISGKNGLS